MAVADNWKVDYQDPRTKFLNGGRSADVVDVHFTITTDPGKGEQGWITVSGDQYDPDVIKSMIDEKVASMQRVAGL